MIARLAEHADHFGSFWQRPYGPYIGPSSVLTSSCKLMRLGVAISHSGSLLLQPSTSCDGVGRLATLRSIPFY
jgi:hypothetical protein